MYFIIFTDQFKLYKNRDFYKAIHFLNKLFFSKKKDKDYSKK